MSQPQRLSNRSLAAASSGNVLEWFDFTVYGFLAPIIGKAFFPADDPVASTLSAFAALAAGYLARPLGSVIFGHVGDRIGRKTALIVSVVMMGVASLAIAVLPTYQTIGLAAPAILVLIRIIQGFAVSGEYTSSGVLVVELAPPGRQHTAGSTIAFAMMIGCMIGSGVPAGVSAVLTEAQMADWGWRIPFAFGALVALTSLVLRLGLMESLPDPDEDVKELPVITVFRDHWRAVCRILILLAPIMILYFVIFVYASSFLTAQMHDPSSTLLEFSTANLLVAALLVPPIGWIADKVGSRPVFFVGAVLMIVTAIPFWSMMQSENLDVVFWGQMGFSAINSAGWALSVSTLATMLPAAVRCSGVSVAYNTGAAVFGGCTPLILTYLFTRTGDDFLPAYYVLITAILSLVVIIGMPSREREISALKG